MSVFKLFMKCFFSPSLYMTYKDQNNGGRYTPDRLEKIGDSSLWTVCLFWKLGLYTSPFLAIMFYRRGFMNADGVMTLTRLSLWMGLLVGASLCIRSYGRATNPRYRRFLTTLSNADSPAGVAKIKEYDFDFSAWPVEFHLPIRTSKPNETSKRSGLGILLQSPCSLLGYAVLHTVGIRLIYPGSISLINYLFKDALMEGRKDLVVEKRGVRYKLKTPEGNVVDTMLIDRRETSQIEGSKNSSRGNILVICTEGNAGFYENGIMNTALGSECSVLGWNHPGFGWSSGVPYINEEESAINTVMEFAIQSLGFPPEDIVMFGWSIGGFASAWSAAAYPELRGVIVDATFDDILPLAINQMPSFLETVVRVTIRTYADLNVARLLLDYQGRILMVRRSDDEIMAIIPGDITSNRGNFLLGKILKRRYPNLISDGVLNEWLSLRGESQRSLRERKIGSSRNCQEIVESYVNDHGPSFPYTELGKNLDEDIKERLTLYLAGEYMMDFVETHCVPLSVVIFHGLVGELT